MALDMNVRILIVDDSGTMRMMFKQMLKKAGFTNVCAAVDGQDAINKLKEEAKVDLVLSDWNMPNMDGLELLMWMRANDPFKEIPFIMATAQSDKAQQQRIMSEGGNDHIAKPFDSDQILGKIQNVFGVSQEVAEKRVRKVIDGKVQMKIGHIQITDHLTLGILRHQIQSGEVVPKYFDLETTLLPGWNPIQENLERGDIDGAFVLAPIAMDLYAFEVPIKLIVFAHKNGSSFVRSKTFDPILYDSLKAFYKYKVVNIPHKMSIHNMLAHKFLSELGLRPGVPGKRAIDVRFEVVPPIKMPLIMKENEDIAGFIVAEPIASNAVAKEIADLQFISSNLWDNHPCCVFALRDEFIKENTDAVYEFTSLLIKAGKFVESHVDQAAEIAVGFLDPQKKIGLTTEVLKKVLTEPKGIKMNDLYPVLEDLDTIQRYMHDNMGIGSLIDVEKFVDLRFADVACKA